MDRRTFLQSLASLLAFASPAAGAPAQLPPPGATTRRFIDVHCHFFNAADLPIRGFLQRVVLADYAYAQNASLAPLAVWRGMIAKLADYVLKSSAPTPSAELACLKDATQCDGYSLGAPRRRSRTLAHAGVDNATSALTDVLEGHYERSRAMSRGGVAPRAAQGDDDVNAFVDYLIQEMDKEGSNRTGAHSSRSLQTAPQSRGVFQSIAEYILSGSSFVSRYFHWAGVLSDYRANIANDYLKLYDPTKSRLILATPALVDYNYWLEDQSPSAIPDQVEVMALLSLQLAKPAHGFAPFDPLREIRRGPNETSSLQHVQNAVLNRGFLGVKIYSPMGFRPSGNAESGLSFPAYAAQTDKDFGHRLDSALDELYAWCEAEEVPILAHTTDSQSAGPEFASRANPKFWEAVIAKYPRLKLNLAHFGNFSQAIDDRTASKEAALALFDNTWERVIGGFVKDGRFPNVYADISYFNWVLEGSDKPIQVEAAKAMFKKYIATYDPNVERLLFGTDWNMTGKANGFEHYIENVEAFFRAVGLNESQLDNLFYRNALRFLGLAADTKAKRRLETFYRENGKALPSFA
jgi:predicted TIM-barrel fold metal-dependent hydrolase